MPTGINPDSPIGGQADRLIRPLADTAVRRYAEITIGQFASMAIGLPDGKVDRPTNLYDMLIMAIRRARHRETQVSVVVKTRVVK
eukprot:1071551-Pyramimonas_sp.AAC.2